jgi:hypothetical protein
MLLLKVLPISLPSPPFPPPFLLPTSSSLYYCKSTVYLSRCPSLFTDHKTLKSNSADYKKFQFIKLKFLKGKGKSSGGPGNVTEFLPFFAIFCHFLPFFAIFCHFLPFFAIFCHFCHFFRLWRLWRLSRLNFI